MKQEIKWTRIRYREIEQHPETLEQLQNTMGLKPEIQSFGCADGSG
jgi:hypothetical protein